MRLADLLRQARNALCEQPLRVALITVAMGLGVGAVVVLVALGESARQYIVREFEALGTHLVVVLPGRSETVGGPPPILGETPRDLTLDDAEALLRSPHIEMVAPVTVGEAPVAVLGQALERDATIMGTTHALLPVRRLRLSQGRFLPQGGSQRAPPVCVIGQTLRTELFPNRPALGQWLRIHDRRFRVIGVLAREGQSIGVGFDELVIIPVTHAQALFDTQGLFRVLIEATSKSAVPAAVEDARRIIKTRHEGEEDVTLITQDSVIGAFDKILAALTWSVAGIASMSLLVAGVLIMNVMWISVAQRTSEIGLLRALGATRRQMVRWFLTEALLLSLTGALGGALLGVLAVNGLRAYYPTFPFVLPLWALCAALAVALGTGLGFGVWPARRAARLDPVQALGKR